MSEIIRIRNDDVINKDHRNWVRRRNPPYRFAQMHRWCLEDTDNFIHVPSIMVEAIQFFPETVQYIKEQTKLGLMEPQIHGLDHEDYGARDRDTVTEHLTKCKDWFMKELDVVPTKWYTPHGAETEELHAIANEMDLELIGTKNVITVTTALSSVRATGDLDTFRGKELFIHWWERGNRLRKLVSVYKFGGCAEAQNAEPDLWEL